MRATLKFLHLLGLALFLGSIPGHVVLGMIGPDNAVPAQGVLFARMVTKMVTLAVTVPGLVLAIGAGFGLLWLSGWFRRRPGWASLHLSLGLLVLANGTFVITPAVMELAVHAQALVDGTFDPAGWARAKRVEDVAGAINVIVTVAAMAVAVARPAFRRRVA